MRAEVMCQRLYSLNKNIYPGPDMINYDILSEGAQMLIKPFSVVFSHSLNREAIPENRKLVHIATIIKGGQLN